MKGLRNNQQSMVIRLVGKGSWRRKHKELSPLEQEETKLVGTVAKIHLPIG